MFENIMKFFKKFNKKGESVVSSKEAAKERLHLVLMQDRANVSADFLELMKQEIIEVIKKYIDVDENAIDVRLTNKENTDGTNGAPALYANIPILNIKHDDRKPDEKEEKNKKDNEKAKKVDEVEKKDVKESKVKEETDNVDSKKEETDIQENKEIIIDDSSIKEEKEEENKEEDIQENLENETEQQVKTKEKVKSE